MSRLARLAAAILGIAALSACTNTQERVTGAGVGAVTGAVVGGPVGAAVGGVAGAVSGPTVASATGVPQSRARRATTTSRTR
jgi:osmotically inducible lipoprotein OsmB